MKTLKNELIKNDLQTQLRYALRGTGFSYVSRRDLWPGSQ
jgi:hypothetical protein